MKYYKSPLIIALTGGIGSGQSTVAGFFQRWGARVINADQKAREVIASDKGLQKDLSQAFGAGIFTNGRLNNKELARLAFRDEFQTQTLNRLVHPHMVELLVEEMEASRFSGKFPLIVIDAALIYEIHIEQLFDFVVVIDAPLPVREARVRERDKMSRQQFLERNQRQLDLNEKVRWADYVILNDGDMAQLEEKARQVYDALINRQRELENPRSRKN